MDGLSIPVQIIKASCRLEEEEEEEGGRGETAVAQLGKSGAESETTERRKRAQVNTGADECKRCISSLL